MSFERMFAWSMKRGARLLFGLALAFFVAALISSFVTLVDFAGIELFEPNPNVSNYTEPGNLLLAALSPFATSATLLFSALIVNHLDRWALARTGAPNA
ncbi:hypothetical protein [Allopontixanthobacter sp.]|uniref:hypothetical protein n=1 Tax=Allopontixanthobacter sp. TaxID=2906452 RepID=UPI002AB9BC33|nr:hypothetical protein [Allopontixanthobacter sp.]MDZ4306532.1 hypothetical protein [Allopontixanthobacter sp.]